MGESSEIGKNSKIYDSQNNLNNAALSANKRRVSLDSQNSHQAAKKKKTTYRCFDTAINATLETLNVKYIDTE